MHYFDNNFIHIVSVPMQNGHEYVCATRRKDEDMVAHKSDFECKIMMPDAVACALIIRVKDQEPRLLLQNEYRYPLGRFVLSPPAGMIDDDLRHLEQIDMRCSAILATAIKEIYEETGLDIQKETHSMRIISPSVFSSPGMTDENTAMVSIVVDLDEEPHYHHNNTEETEIFENTLLLTKKEAKRLINMGLDPNFNPYPIYTWAMLMWFVSEMWET